MKCEVVILLTKTLHTTWPRHLIRRDFLTTLSDCWNASGHLVLAQKPRKDFPVSSMKWDAFMAATRLTN